MSMSAIGIGKLASESGVPIDTIRHYERVGLLKPASRLASGHRRYGEAERKRRAEDCPILNALTRDARP
jgi:DNA-binding transcriptional MerR regulator